MGSRLPVGRFASCLFVSVMGPALIGCDRHAPGTAVVNMTWTLDGKDSVERCAAHKAAWLEIEIARGSGERAFSLTHKCYEPHPIDLPDKAEIPQGVSANLKVGEDYVATARLLDAKRNPVTRPVGVTLRPGSSEEPNFEFRGAFTNGTE